MMQDTQEIRAAHYIRRHGPKWLVTADDVRITDRMSNGLARVMVSGGMVATVPLRVIDHGRDCQDAADAS